MMPTGRTGMTAIGIRSQRCDPDAEPDDPDAWRDYADEPCEDEDE